MCERCQGWLPGGKSRCANPAKLFVEISSRKISLRTLPELISRTRVLPIRYGSQFRERRGEPRHGMFRH